MSEAALATKADARTGRFKVGQRIVAMRYVITGRSGLFSNPMYCPWSDKLERIELKVLTVQEHHVVPNCHDPKGVPCADGYVLRDQEGAQWGNQYPTAAYGQVSTDADWLFERMMEDAQVSSASDDELSIFEVAERVLERIKRGVDHFEKPGETQNAEYAQALRQHMSELEAQITEATGAEIIFEPIWQRAPHVLRARIKLD